MPAQARVAGPTAPAPNRSLRNLLIGVGGILGAFICLAVLAVVIGSSTRDSTKTYTTTRLVSATAAALTGATEEANAVQDAPQTPAPADTAIDSEPSTATEPPAPTNTALPTATPLPPLAFGDTAQLGDWNISLARIETRIDLGLSAGQSHARGRWWLVWLDAKNNSADTRRLGSDLTLELRDASGGSYGELAAMDADTALALARSDSRDLLSDAVAPGALVHPILAFDVPAEVQPAMLLLRHSTEEGTDAGYDLSASVAPALEAAAAIDAKATEIAQVDATSTAQAVDAATAAAEQAATTVAASAAETATAEVAASNKQATAEAKAAAQATAASAKGKVEISYVYYDGQQYRVEGDEYAEISNTGGALVNLKGYRLNAGDPGQDFYFPSRVLKPDESLKVYTNAYGDAGDYSFDIGRAIWNNDGDCGYLFDPQGNEVSEYCY